VEKEKVNAVPINTFLSCGKKKTPVGGEIYVIGSKRRTGGLKKGKNETRSFGEGWMFAGKLRKDGIVREGKGETEREVHAQRGTTSGVRTFYPLISRSERGETSSWINPSHRHPKRADRPIQTNGD